MEGGVEGDVHLDDLLCVQERWLLQPKVMRNESVEPVHTHPLSLSPGGVVRVYIPVASVQDASRAGLSYQLLLKLCQN